MSENDAISLAKLGDSSAFEFLYRLHHTNVLNRCRQMLRDEEEAEDQTQEVFLLLWQKIKLFNHRSAFASWLYRLTTNKVLCHMRHKKSRPPTGAGDAPDTCIHPDQHTRLEIMEALDNLTDMQRFCVDCELAGNSVKGLGGRGYLKAAHQSLRGQLV